MKLPFFRSGETTEIFQRSFGGYNRNEGTPDRGFYDARNISSDKYPLLSVRKKRGIWYEIPQDIYGEAGEMATVKIFNGSIITGAAQVNGKMCITAGTSVYYDGTVLSGAVLEESDEERCIVPFGKSFFILPDGIYITPDEAGCLVQSVNVTNTASSAVLSVCDKNGNTSQVSTEGDSPPVSPSDGAVWLDTSVSPPLMKLYSTSNAGWTVSYDYYTAISAASIGASLCAGDVIRISGFPNAEVNGEHEIINVTQNKIVIVLSSSTVTSVSGVLRVKRRMPPMDFAVECGNRIWGCRYGLNYYNSDVNEIYSCKQGDPLNWFTFKGISTDSYCASLSCPGSFTGCAVLGHEPVFFKEDNIIKISGSVPSEFTVNTISARGVESGSARSLVCLNEKLFYKSRAGFAVYDGTLPYIISEELGSIKYVNAVGGQADSKYYAAVQSLNGDHFLFVYDTLTDIWCRENDPDNIRYFVNVAGVLYMISLALQSGSDESRESMYAVLIHDYSMANRACRVFNDNVFAEYGFIEEGNVTWFAELRKLGLDSPQTKRLCFATVSLRLASGGTFSVYISGDNGTWKQIFSLSGTHEGTFRIPINIGRNNYYNLRFNGTGECVIFSLSRIVQKGGEVNMLGR